MFVRIVVWSGHNPVGLISLFVTCSTACMQVVGRREGEDTIPSGLEDALRLLISNAECQCSSKDREKLSPRQFGRRRHRDEARARKAKVGSQNVWEHPPCANCEDTRVTENEGYPTVIKQRIRKCSGDVVDFALILMHEYGESTHHIARIDCAHGTVHIHGPKVFERKFSRHEFEDIKSQQVVSTWYQNSISKIWDLLDDMDAGKLDEHVRCHDPRTSCFCARHLAECG